jgi:hypothetical protein
MKPLGHGAVEFLATDETRREHGFYKARRAAIFVAAPSTNESSSVQERQYWLPLKAELGKLRHAK